MRPFAILTILLSFVTFILSFLCLFAGSKPSFMQNYHLISLNTSRVGANVLSDVGAGSPLAGILGGLSGDVSSLISDIAHEVGIADFYNLHVLDYCEGEYTPIAVPNATVSSSQIHQNASYCSPKTKRYTPGQALQQDLNKGGKGITLSDINWPTEIDDQFNKLYDALDAVIALYAVAIFFSFLTILWGIYWFVRSSGRCSIIICSIWACLAFVLGGIAAGAITGISVKGVDIINGYVDSLSIEAYRGNKFLAITWAATGCALLAWIVTIFGICCGAGHRRDRVKRVSV